MTLSPMIGMDSDLVDESTGRPLGADQDADRVGAREGDHAAAAPDLKVADRPLERGRRHRRIVGKVRRPAAIQRVDEKHDVVGAAEAVRAHRSSTLRTHARSDAAWAQPRRNRLGGAPGSRCERTHRIEHRLRAGAGAPSVGRDHLGHHLLAELDPLLDQRKSIVDDARSRASSSTRSCVLFRMKPAGTRKTRCAASVVHSNVEISGFFRSSRATSLASPAAPPGRSLVAPSVALLAPSAGGLDVERRAGLLLDHLRANSRVIASSFIMRARFSTRALTRRR